LDRGTSLLGNEQVGWNFKPVRLSQAVVASVIGRHATIRYKIGGKSHTAATVVADGRCKSLI